MFPDWIFSILPLLLGWLLDLCLGDPAWLPHPVVGFGKLIAFFERILNKGAHRMLKGAVMSVALIGATYAATAFLISSFSFLFSHSSFLISALLIFYCLAGTTLIREVRAVFLAVDRSLDEGRRQVARIVGRDTRELSAQEVRTAALETLAENLSDGVIAPLLWLAVLGVPGMMAYKMVNTLDSMIGYRTPRYRDFGCWAARIDDVANYIPARLSALLMLLAHPWPLTERGEVNPSKGIFSPLHLRNSFHSTHFFSLLNFILRYGHRHASPNSGYPEAALAGILDCRFGGPHTYFGQLFDKPYIGTNPRPLSTRDMLTAVRINRTAEVLMVALAAAALLLKS